MIKNINKNNIIIKKFFLYIIFFTYISFYYLISISYGLEERYSEKRDISLDSGNQKSYSNQTFNSSKVGDFYNAAKILVTNNKTGKNEIITVKVGDEKINFFDGLNINLTVCWSQSESILFPESKALIEIYHLKNRKKIFSGWIFATNHSISQPFYTKYLFSLVKCVSR